MSKDTAAAPELKHALLERLIHYYHFVSEQLESGEGSTVTSTQIAGLVHMDDTLVRKDLAAIGVQGVPRIGFRSAEIVHTIRELLGFEQSYQAVIIGAGRLGGAMASYQGFARYGLRITTLFDDDPNKVGLIWGDYVVQPMKNLAKVVKKDHVTMAIITVPAEVAQDVAAQAVAAGVKALWNFSSTNLSVPEDVFVRHEHISVGLAELSYALKRGQHASMADE